MGDGIVTECTEAVARHVDARQRQVAFCNIHILVKLNDDLV